MRYPIAASGALFERPASARPRRSRRDTRATDLKRQQVDVNQLDRPVITTYYERGWRTYNN